MKFFFSKYFFVGLFILIVLVFIVPFSFRPAPSQPGAITPTGQPIIPLPFFNPQPTAITPSPLSVVQTEPADKEQDFSLSLAITITFSRPLGDIEKLHVRLGLSPQASGSGSWSQDNTQFIFTPQGLTPNTSYQATLLYETATKTWSFTTGDPEPTINPVIKQGLDVQSTYDELWGKKQQQLYQKYPWYDQLPLSAPDYFVSFDIQESVLYANLFPQDPTSVLEINAVKQEVLRALTAIGVNTSTVTIKWQSQQTQ